MSDTLIIDLCIPCKQEEKLVWEAGVIYADNHLLD